MIHNFSMLTFPSVPPPRAVPAARPRRAPRVNHLLWTQKFNSLLLYSNLNPRVRCMMSFTPPSPISHLGLYFDFYEWHIVWARAWTLSLILHLTNPCAKPKVLSVTKPKGKIYKTKSLGNYITDKEFGRCPWCNGYRRRKWTRRLEFKFWTRMIAFHIALIPLGNLWIQLFSLQLWVNSRTDWVLQPW